MKPRLIFVDDEPNILRGLRRILRAKRDEWDVFFAESGADALRLVEQQAPDAIVSDMRMPGMDGAELLQRVAEISPTTLRFVLSGEAEVDAIYRAIGPCHQYLLKPCDNDVLIKRLETVLALQPTDEPEALAQIAGIESLPTPLPVYYALMAELAADNPSAEAISKLMSGDVALSFKALQLMNSNFFGSGTAIVTPEAAIKRLGIDTISDLVGRPGFASRLRDDADASAYDEICACSMATARSAREVSLAAGKSDADADAAWTAGLLNAVVRLAFLSKKSTLPATEMPGGGADGNRSLVRFMMALWGLPDTIINAHNNLQPATCGGEMQ